MPGFPPRRNRETDAPLEMRMENRGSYGVLVGPLVFLSSADGDVGDFLSCLKGVKDPFRAQEGRCVFSPDAATEKGLSSR